MPMIDLTTSAALLPEAGVAELSRRLAEALLRAEGAPLAAPYLENTGVFIHRLPADHVHTAGTANAKTVRVEVLTPPGTLNRQAQRQLVAEITQTVADHLQDPAQAGRTWVLLGEAAERWLGCRWRGPRGARLRRLARCRGGDGQRRRRVTMVNGCSAPHGVRCSSRPVSTSSNGPAKTSARAAGS